MKQPHRFSEIGSKVEKFIVHNLPHTSPNLFFSFKPDELTNLALSFQPTFPNFIKNAFAWDIYSCDILFDTSLKIVRPNGLRCLVKSGNDCFNTISLTIPGLFPGVFHEAYISSALFDKTRRDAEKCGLTDFKLATQCVTGDYILDLKLHSARRKWEVVTEAGMR